MKKSFLYILILLILVITTSSTNVLANNQEPNIIENLADHIIEYGKRHLKTPYRRGATGPSYFDCSGFTSYVYGYFGFLLPHSSSAQANHVSSITKKELQKGDLVFFEGRSHNGRVGHVGIVTDSKSDGTFNFIHASTQRGVIISNSQEDYYRRRFVGGGRVLSNEQLGLPFPLPNHTSTNETTEYHTVQEGESLESIAKNYNVSIEDLKKENNLSENTVALYQILRIKSHAEVASETGSNAINITLAETNNSPGSLQTTEEEKLFQETEHSVKRGETLYLISKKYNVSIEELKEINHLKGNNLQIGQILKISENKEQINTPSSVVEKTSTKHIVKSGESLYAIAKQYDCSINDLKQWNNKQGNKIKAGEELLIYSKSE